MTGSSESPISRACAALDEVTHQRGTGFETGDLLDELLQLCCRRAELAGVGRGDQRRDLATDVVVAEDRVGDIGVGRR